MVLGTEIARNCTKRHETLRNLPEILGFLYVGGGEGTMVFDRQTLDLLTTVVTDLGDAHHIQTDSQGNLYIAATGDGHLRLLFTGLSSTGSEQ